MIKKIEKKSIDFKKLNTFEVKNFKKKALSLNVVPVLDKTILTENNINEIVEACNQVAVYDFLFREKLSGKKYTKSDAESFIDWAVKGWVDGLYFVYLLRLNNDKIIGCIDIKSNNPELAEIGYWASSDFPGYMTNVVLEIIEQARRVGFEKLVAYTKFENIKSKGVLKRAGFNYVGREENEVDKIHDKFICEL